MTDETTETTADAPAAPSIDFNTYMGSLPSEAQEMYKKNGVDSFDKQTKWVAGLNTALGKKGLVRPSDDATEEAKTAYKDAILKEMGRPDDGKYEFDLPEGSKDEYYSEEFLGGLAKVAYDSGMDQKGFQNLVDAIAKPYNEFMTGLEKQLMEIKAKIGEEDKIDDNADNVEVKLSKEQVHEQARQKLIEANDLHRKGNYNQAIKLKNEAQELYNQVASM